ncbi:MAG: type II toxin-antitoxin system HicA family toxin [Methylobacter sp.]
MRYYKRMSKADKLLDQMRRNPRDWRIEDVKTVALHFAVDWRNMGGSHHVFGMSGIAEKVCVPAHKPIKPAYIRQFVALIDKVKELQA